MNSRSSPRKTPAISLAGKFFLAGIIALSLSCTLESSPFGTEPATPFSVNNLSILNSLRYLPDDPADMSPSDMEFYRTKPWIVIRSISNDFTAANGYIPNYYEDFNMRLSHMKYLIHTRVFAEWILDYAFALRDTQNKRPLQVLDQGLRSPKYRSLNKTYHVNPLEILLVLRNAHYKVSVARNPNAQGAYTASGGNLGNFNPKLPFNGWDPIADGGFVPGTSFYHDNGKYGPISVKGVIWVDTTLKTPIKPERSLSPSLFMHEVLHNWGYADPKAPGVPVGSPEDAAGKGTGKGGVVYNVQNVIDRVYSEYWARVNPKYRSLNKEALYVQRSESGTLPNIYDVRNTPEVTEVTDKYDGKKKTP